MKQKLNLKLALFACIIALLPNLASAGFHDGKIYLQVEEQGQAWYVNPTDHYRYFLNRPDDAFSIMRNLGLGISEKNIAQIPIGLVNFQTKDSDLDGLSDDLEVALGTDKNNPDTDGDDYSDKTEIENWQNPLGSGELENNLYLTNSLNGRILLQTEKNGEAWYLNPQDKKRYYLGRPADAFAIMRQLGIGITNANLNNIAPTYVKSTHNLSGLYTVKYPADWNRAMAETKEDEYQDIPILSAYNYFNESAQLKVYVLETEKDKTLNDLKIDSKKYAEKIIDKQELFDIKPALRQEFNYNTNFEKNDQPIQKGAEYIFDIMLSTHKFIHLQMTVYNQSDQQNYKNYFEQIIKDLQINY